MERLKPWVTEVWAGVVSCLCWFTPEHCEQVSHVFGMFANFFGALVAALTLIFVTYPKVIESRMFKRLFGLKNAKK